MIIDDFNLKIADHFHLHREPSLQTVAEISSKNGTKVYEVQSRNGQDLQDLFKKTSKQEHKIAKLTGSNKLRLAAIKSRDAKITELTRENESLRALPVVGEDGGVVALMRPIARRA